MKNKFSSITSCLAVHLTALFPLDVAAANRQNGETAAWFTETTKGGSQVLFVENSMLYY